MNQNIPPSEPGFSSEEARDGGNPYLAGSRQSESPDLDANAPFLNSPRDRRLNMKMLAFVAAAVLLLLFVLFVMYKRLTTDDKPTAPQKEETVDIPVMPMQDQIPAPPLPEQNNVPPIELAADSELPAPSSNRQSTAQAASGPTLLERRIIASGGGGASDTNGGAQSAESLQAMQMRQQMLQSAGLLPASPQAADNSVTSAQPLRNPDTLLVRGTYIRCVLETRIITDIPGFTSCIVTEPVYSINGRKLLLPKGSKVLGSYDTDANGPRVAVIWDRITTPNGFDVNMKSPGVDGLGSAGHPGDYNAHWASRLSSAIMISLVADAFKYAAAENGPPQNQVGLGGVVVQSPYESVTARTVERLSNQVLQKSMNRPATVTINQGTVVNVYVAKDVDFIGVLPRALR